MDRSDLEAVRTIVAHDDCADGTASAILLHDALPNARVVFADYGESAKRLPVEPRMLFCDFSPPPARADEFVQAGAIVLDHHRSARAVVEKFGERGVFADETRERGVSGAVLAYRHVWKPLVANDNPSLSFAEWFATAAGVRDTWHKQHPAWGDGVVQHALLMAFPQAFWLSIPLSTLAREWTTRYAWVGEQLIAQHRDRVEGAFSTLHRFVTADGTRVAVSPFLGLASDLAERVGESADVVVCFGYGKEADEHKMFFSLRSHAQFDCAAFAERHGGGGHTRASGMAIAVGDNDPQPFRVIEQMFARAI
jgi:hypothetical protein